jgi:hypothetical protein
VERGDLLVVEVGARTCTSAKQRPSGLHPLIKPVTCSLVPSLCFQKCNSYPYVEGARRTARG